MARRVYFAFHYDDIFRVNVIRKSGLLQEQAGFFDGSLWEEAETKGDAALKKLMDDGLKNTSVTVILLGTETASRHWVKYELEKSYDRGNGLLAIHINSIPGLKRTSLPQGPNIFDAYSFPKGHARAGQMLSTFYKTYDWVINDGYDNFGTWVEAAANQVGK